MAGIVDFIKDTQKKFQFLKWVQIIPQESLATKKSALYFVEKNDTEVDAIVIDDLGQKRKLTGLVTGTGIQSIQEGDNVSIDNTDPLNPIVSAGGGTTGNYIPLSGTEVGKPVTGDIEIADKVKILCNDGSISLSASSPETKSSIIADVDRIYLGYDPFDGDTTSLTLREDDILVSVRKNGLFDTNSGGLLGDGYFGFNYVPNSYVQKKYVDQANSYSTEETLTGGTWIDDEPIYKITQLTSDPAPTVDTMIKSTVVGGTYTEYEYTKLAE